MKPEEPHENQEKSRSLGIALGVTEFIYLLGVLLLATGAWLVFGFGWALLITGAVFVVSAWLMQFVP